MGLGARLLRLERSTAASDVYGLRCKTCGHFTDGRRLPPGSYDIKVYGGNEDPPPDLGPERCRDCGAQLVIRVEFDRGG